MYYARTTRLWSLSVYSRSEFETLFQVTYAWAGATPGRWPLTDWYRTDGQGDRVAYEARSMCKGEPGCAFFGDRGADRSAEISGNGESTVALKFRELRGEGWSEDTAGST